MPTPTPSSAFNSIPLTDWYSYRSSVKFVKTNVTVWAEQLNAFKTAISSSPSGRIDIVIANAGISGADEVFANEGSCSRDISEIQPRLTCFVRQLKRMSPQNHDSIYSMST